MKARVLDYLRCPACGGALTVAEAAEAHGEVRDGTLACGGCGARYPVRRYVPRVAPGVNYSDSWGELWNETGAILRDSFTGLPFHRNALHGTYDEDANGLADGVSPFGFAWPTDLSGQRVLEVGPGTGNFTEHLADTGADLVCVDMSNAIDTLPEELLTRANVDVIQGDITHRHSGRRALRSAVGLPGASTHALPAGDAEGAAWTLARWGRTGLHVVCDPIQPLVLPADQARSRPTRVARDRLGGAAAAAAQVFAHAPSAQAHHPAGTGVARAGGSS